MQPAKETASNVAASAKSGMEKTKATMQEKGEKMTTRDPLQKDMATHKKEERIHQAELQKQEAQHHNAATKQAASIGSGQPGYTTGGDFTTQQHPVGGTGTGTHTATDPTMGGTGLTGRVKPHDPNVGGGAGTGYGSGATY